MCIGNPPRNKTFISSLVVNVDEREKTKWLKKTKECVSKARKNDNPKENGSINLHNFHPKHLEKNEKIVLVLPQSIKTKINFLF